MSRKDNKGRVLKDGEYQRKDGRYEYKYVDAFGKRRSFYSWKLTPSDKVKDKFINTESIREARKRIDREIEDRIMVDDAKRITVSDIFYDVIMKQTGRKNTTMLNYLYAYNANLRDTIGDMPVSAIKRSTLIKLYTSLINEKDLSATRIQLLHSLMWAILQVAQDDNLVKHNAAEKGIPEITRSTKKPNAVCALSKLQQERILEFLSVSEQFNKYYTLFVVLLGTGCRIAEACGLTWDDIDFDNRLINISKNLLKAEKVNTGNKPEYYISTPKTKAGGRKIPMITDVMEVLMAERTRQEEKGFCPYVVDGVSGFVFMTSRKTPFSSQYAGNVFRRIERSYNEYEQLMFEHGVREPVYIDKLRPHVLRHTFATRLFEVEDNIKIIQEILGHASYVTTMNIYVDVTDEHRIERFEKLDSKLCVLHS